MTANQAAQAPSERPMGDLAPLKLATLPVYAGLLAYLGPGMIVGHVTSPITGSAEAIPATGFYFADTAENKRNYKGWVRYFSFENGVGVTQTLMLLCTAVYVVMAVGYLILNREQLLGLLGGG